MQLVTTLKDALSVYAHKRVLLILFLGFSSGLPLVLVFSTLSFWLREAGIERTAIGYFSWILTAYSVKWLWAPLVDKIRLPLLANWLGQRRSWMLLAQIALVFGIWGMSNSDPAANIEHLALFALLVAFASATQDIVIDAFRIESAPEKMQAALAAASLLGYRSAMIIGTAGALAVAAWVEPSTHGYHLHAWQFSYKVMSALMLVGIIVTLFAKEPVVDKQQNQLLDDKIKSQFREKYPQQVADILSWLYSACVIPFSNFFNRYGKHAIVILLLISTYRISDIVMGIMANVFYVDMGFSKEEIAFLSKVFGLIMTLVGAAFGGILLAKFGTMRILFLGALLTAVTNLLFAVQAMVGHSVPLLTVIISIDNFSAGIATAAFIAYLSSLTASGYSATQYALLSSIMLLFPKFVAGFAGAYVDAFGYVNFYVVASLIGFPVLWLICLVNRTERA
ncbi:AmpG family muropeptide MFS transporter [Parashewanella tropica]|uniref:AmpG family muropeptide MFS transporter n=1 Tax=Parashewanella tropica TaxID=2547970 RepID=UPI0010596517|nr:MFS transporter [Parashewanella tropica]